MPKIEYRVIPVTRYIVTRFTVADDGKSEGSQPKGEFPNSDMAYSVAYALCKHEHEQLGYPPGDERITYPRHPDRASDDQKEAMRFLPPCGSAGPLPWPIG